MGYRNASAPNDSDFKALLEASHWDGLTSAAQRVLQRLDLDDFMINMRIANGHGRPQVYVLSTLPVSLYEGFRSDDKDNDDPVCKHVRRHGIPLTWEIDHVYGVFQALPYRELKNLGIHAGWSVAARNEHSFSRIDIYSRTPQNFALMVLHSDLLLFSCYLNDAVSALWLRQNPPKTPPILTEREQQCLRWSASGKTSNEIGAILGISQNTVYFHLKKAASKFDVYGTRHAISRAMQLGLI